MIKIEEYTLELKSDEELMLEFKKGNFKSFDILVIRYMDRIINFIYRCLGDYEKSKDLAQITFLAVHNAAKKYQPTAKFSTWLYKIARYQYLMEKRTRTRHPIISFDDTTSIITEEGQSKKTQDLIPSILPHPDDKIIKDEIQVQIRQAVNSLPDIYREIIMMRMYQKLSYSEIAEITGSRENTIRSRLRNALNKLKHILKTRKIIQL